MAENRCIHTDCEGFYRRDFLKAGALGLFGLSLTDFFRLKAHAATAAANVSTPSASTGAATSVILVWLGGGPSHLDMWDLKPEAPEEIRGLFKPIATNVNGIQVSEHLPRLAQQTDKLCIIRSMTSPEAAHERGTHYMMTGYQPLTRFRCARIRCRCLQTQRTAELPCHHISLFLPLSLTAVVRILRRITRAFLARRKSSKQKL